MLDGAVARAMGTASRFGAFFDSMIDRYAEAGVLVALIAYFAGAGESVFALGSALALVGSLLVSYARARAEGLGVDCEVGILQRPERVVLLGIGLLFPDLLLAPVVWGLAAVANATAVQRILHVRRLLSQASPPSAP
jgi:CDP-diacylglycerol--glycerol-3-phosphate 3-phosphatidyltransferase